MTNVRRQPGRSPNGEVYVYSDSAGVRDYAVAALQLEFGPSKVRGTGRLEEAADWLRDGHPVALVTSVRGGAKLICAARSAHKRLPIILLSKRGDELGGTAIGNTQILNRSFRDRALYSAIEQLLPGRSTPVLGTDKPSKPIAELLELLTRVGYGGTLRLASPDDPRRGEIGLRGGRVVHGQVGEETGMDALMVMAKWRNVEFAWSQSVPGVVNVNVTPTDISEFVAELDQRDPPADIEQLLDRSRPQEQEDSSLTPFPRNPTHGVGNTDTEVEPLSGGADAPQTQADSEGLSQISERRGTRSMSNNIDETLDDLSDIDGFIAAAIVDSESGMSLGTLGGNNDFDVDVAAAANTDVVQAKMRAVRKLELEDAIEDILITLGGQHHLIRPLRERPNVFFYLALDREKSNLAMARMSVADAGAKVDI